MCGAPVLFLSSWSKVAGTLSGHLLANWLISWSYLRRCEPLPGRLGSLHVAPPDFLPDLSPNEANPFIDHLSEIWNFRRDRPLSAVLCSHEKGEAMKKTLMALVAVATLAVSAVAVPAPAQAQRGVAAGVAAGLIGGAIVGGAIASQNGYYGPGYYAPPRLLWRRPGLCRRSRLRPGLLLAAPALLGRLWLAGPQRPGLRLDPVHLH